MPELRPEASILDRVVRKVEELPTRPAIIAAALDRRRQQDPATGDPAAVERRHGETARKQCNLIRRLAALKDDGPRSSSGPSSRPDRGQAKRLELERAALAGTREGGLLARGRPAALET